MSRSENFVDDSDPHYKIQFALNAFNSPKDQLLCINTLLVESNYAQNMKNDIDRAESTLKEYLTEQREIIAAVDAHVPFIIYIMIKDR